MAAKAYRALVTLDKVFELVEGNLSSEKRADISDIGQRFKGDPQDGGWALRVAKVICLLEFIRDLPRTEANIAACLVDLVGQAAPLAEVQAAVAKLQDAQIIRSTDAGWKLQIERNVKVNLVEQGLALAERILDQNPSAEGDETEQLLQLAESWGESMDRMGWTEDDFGRFLMQMGGIEEGEGNGEDSHSS